MLHIVISAPLPLCGAGREIRAREIRAREIRAREIRAREIRAREIRAREIRAREFVMCSGGGGGCTSEGEKRYTLGKLCGGCPRKKVTPRAMCPYLLPDKHTTRSVTKPSEVLL